MPLEQVTYQFPDEDNPDGVDVEIELEPSSAEEVQIPGRENPKPVVDKTKREEKKEDDDEGEIEIVDDTPEEDQNREPAPEPDEVTDEELESYSDKVRKRIKHFSKSYHDERREKEKAYRERQELEAVAKRLMEENQKLKGTVGKSRTALLAQAKRAIGNEIEKAKQSYLSAYEAGDGDALFEAQSKLNDLQTKKTKLDNINPESLQKDTGNVQIESNRQPQPQQPARPQQPALDEMQKAWLSKNTWYGKDDEMTSYALGLDSKLKKEGVDPRSQEFYQRVDKRLREVFPDNFEDTKETRPVETKPNVVAAPTRGQSGKKVRLTKSQVAVAKRLGLTPQQYATQLMKEMRNG